MDYISLMVLAMPTQLKKTPPKRPTTTKKSQAHCCLLFSLLDDLSDTELGFSNSEEVFKDIRLVGLGYGKVQGRKTPQ